MNKIKKTSVLIISAIFIFSIGAVVAYPSATFDGPGHGGCHDNAPEYKDPEFSENASIFKDAAYTEPGISVSPSTTLYPSMSFIITIYIVNFTEANNVSSGRRDAGQSSNVTVQLSPDRGNNTDFNIITSYQAGVVLDGDGDSAAVIFNLDAPSVIANDYNLTIDAIHATNYTIDDWAPIIFATASINITVIARPDLGPWGGQHRSHGPSKEEAIPGYDLTIFVVAMVLITGASAIIIFKKRLAKTIKI